MPMKTRRTNTFDIPIVLSDKFFRRINNTPTDATAAQTDRYVCLCVCRNGTRNCGENLLRFALAQISLCISKTDDIKKEEIDSERELPNNRCKSFVHFARKAVYLFPEFNLLILNNRLGKMGK